MNPRKTYTYKQLRQTWLKQQPPICHWCGRHVSQNLPLGHPLKATLDHLIEVDSNPELALDPQLWVVACHTCNTRHDSSILPDVAHYLLDSRQHRIRQLVGLLLKRLRERPRFHVLPHPRPLFPILVTPRIHGMPNEPLRVR